LSTFLWAIPRENVKNIVKHVILELSRFNPDGIPRVELYKKINLSQTAITVIINNLQDIGFINEVEGRYPSGRKPIVLKNSNAQMASKRLRISPELLGRGFSGMGVMVQALSLVFHKQKRREVRLE